MKVLYAWVPWFNALARSIADSDEAELADRASRIDWRENDRSSPLLKYSPENVDPFSFIYTVATHCLGREGRARVLESVATVFNLALDLPLDDDDAFYFPHGTPLNTLFHQKGEGNPRLLWELLRQAVCGRDSVRGQVFDDALRIGNVGTAKLTQALFLIDGRTFLPCDSSSRPLLCASVPARPNWNQYLEAIDGIRERFPGCELYEVNLFAYLTYSKRLHIGQGIYQVSSNVLGDGTDHWNDFNQNCWVYTGGQAPGVPFGHRDDTPPNAYPLSDPDQGDLILARNAGDGRGIGIVWRNDYRQTATPDTRLHVLWLNKLRAQLGFAQQRGFSRAKRVEEAFRKCEEYSSTLKILDQMRVSNGGKVGDGPTKLAVLATLAEYDQRGRKEFLQHYGYKGATSRHIRHQGRRYDMKSIWRAAFGHMKGGHALTPKDEQYKTKGRNIKRKLEKLGLEVIDGPTAQLSPTSFQPLNQILYGPPGTGKTWRTVNLALAIVDGQLDGDHELDRFNGLRFDAENQSGNVAMVTFHQNFSYEDFVEGIRPRLDESGRGLQYGLHKGLFRRIAEAAVNRPEERFVLIIDEINRGNIARIFGELITLIEESRRIGGSEATWVSLPYSQEQFGVPSNLHLVGTMNTADRSIQLLDTALRRRFTFIEMMPDYRDLESIQGVDCARMLQSMNERITILLDREHQIGHTYLLKLTDSEDLVRRFQDQLFPLLQEYFFDDWSRIKVVLGNSPFIIERASRTVVDNPELIDEDHRVFERLPDNDPRWRSMNSFRAIYETTPQTPGQA